MRNIIYFILLCTLFAGCRKNKFAEKYNVKEEFEVVAGSNTGLKGNNSYQISVSSSNIPNEFIIGNFANSFNVKFSLIGDSIKIHNQRLPFDNGFVYLEGKGIINSDSIIFRYSSGSARGQIECKCTAVSK